MVLKKNQVVAISRKISLAIYMLVVSKYVQVGHSKGKKEDRYSQLILEDDNCIRDKHVAS